MLTLLTTYNRLAYTKEAVKSLLGTCELIVIDNGSTDGTIEWLKQQPLRCVFNQTNRGVAGAMNQFIELTDGEEWISKVDNDTIVEPGWWQHLYDCAMRYHLDLVQAKHHIIKETHPGGWVGLVQGLSKLGDGCYESKYIGGSGIIMRRSKLGVLPEDGWKLGGWNRWQVDHPHVTRGFCEHTTVRLLDEHGYEQYPDYYKETGRL